MTHRIYLEQIGALQSDAAKARGRMKLPQASSLPGFRHYILNVGAMFGPSRVSPGADWAAEAGAGVDPWAPALWKISASC